MTIAITDDPVVSIDDITPAAARPLLPLGKAARGYVGVIDHLAPEVEGSALSAAELERRLLELGFVEGARVEVLHEGIVGRDPIAVRVENVTIAVRRREAMAVIVA
jgi:ferrous iron transport protein A